MRKLIWVAPLIFAAGCASKSADETEAIPTQISSSDEKYLFPAAEGNMWTYSVSTETEGGSNPPPKTNGEVQFQVSSARDDKDGHYANVAVHGATGIEDETTWLIKPDGVYQTAGNMSRVSYSPPMPLMKFPIASNEDLSWSGVGPTADGGTGKENMKINVSFAPQIDTDAGVVSGVCVETTGDFSSAKGSGTVETSAWFQPKVGLVRLVQKVVRGEQTTTTTLRLKSSNLGQ